MINPADPAGALLCQRPGCGRSYPEHVYGGPGAATGSGCPHFAWLPPRTGRHRAPEEDDTPAPGRPG